MRATVDPKITFIAIPDITPQGSDMFVLIAKSRFAIDGCGECQMRCAAPLNFADIFQSDRQHSSIQEPSDLSPCKPWSDLLFVKPVSYSRGSQRSWIASIEINARSNSIKKQFHVFGARNWCRSLLRGWKLSSPSECGSVPLTYENAYGGAWEESSTNWHASNPVGRGFELTSPSFSAACAVAHQFEDVDRAIDKPEVTIEVEGLTAVDRWWMPRTQLAGKITSSDKGPLRPYPLDFSSRYYNCAPAWLQFELGHLPGALVSLKNVGPAPEIEFSLPQVSVWFLFDGLAFEGTADTYAINLTERHIDVTWRADVRDLRLPENLICICEEES